jgi:hypothetical protein
VQKGLQYQQGRKEGKRFKVQRLNEDKGARGNRKLEGGKMEGNSSPPISTPEFCFGDLQIAAISTVDPIENRVISKCHMIYSG